MNLGGRVEAARKALNLKQGELAEKMRVSQQAIQKIEDGRTKMPRDIDKLANHLGVSVEWLITGKNAPAVIEPTNDQEKETSLIVDIFSFLTADQRNSTIEFAKKYMSQNERVFSELSGIMTAKKRIEQLQNHNNHVHA